MAGKAEITSFYKTKVRPQIKQPVEDYYRRVKPVVVYLANLPPALQAALRATKGYDPAKGTCTFPNKLSFQRVAQKAAKLSQRQAHAFSLEDTLTYREASFKVSKRATNVYLKYKTLVSINKLDSRITLTIPDFGMPRPPQIVLDGIRAPLVDSMRRNILSTWVTGTSTTRKRSGSIKFDEQVLVRNAKQINVRATQLRDEKGRGTSESVLLKALNAGTTLHDAVQARMGIAGRLVYRTGRLARSAKATKATRLNSNTLAIEGSYMYDPYSKAFENPGSRLYTEARRPSTLIGGAIRDVVASLLGERFNVLTRTRGV